MKRAPAIRGETTGACEHIRCRAAVRIVKRDDGQTISLDLQLVPEGDLIPVIVKGEKRVRPRQQRDGDRPGFVDHQRTCAGNARPVRRRGGPTVIKTGAALHQGVDRGPCAGCGWPEHTLYGPNSGGTLCPECRTVLGDWRKTHPAERGPIPFPRWNPTTRTRDPRL